MTLNNINLRLLALMVVLSTTLSGCSSMPTFPVFSGGEAEETQSNDTSPDGVVQSDSSESGAGTDDALLLPVQLTPEQVEEEVLKAKALALMGSMNVFKLDK